MQKLPLKTKGAIEARIFKLKNEGKIERRAKRVFRQWSEVEDNWLRDNLSLDIETKCDMLNRDKMAIFNQERKYKK